MSFYKSEKKTNIFNRNNDTVKHSYLLIMLILTFLPFWLIFVISFKDQTQFYHNIWALDFPMHFENYTLAFKVIGKYMLNSIIVSIVTVIGVVAVSSLSAYVFARYEFPFKEFLFFCIISLLMVPNILTMVPAFIMIKNFGLINTLWALILPGIAGLQIFAIYLMKNFMASIPEELFEATRMDGAGLFRGYWHLALPLSRPVITMVIIVALLTTWNDFIWPYVVIIDDDLRTIPIGLSFFHTQYETIYGPLMAGYVISIVPLFIVFVFISREFIKGMTTGALKL